MSPLRRVVGGLGIPFGTSVCKSANIKINQTITSLSIGRRCNSTHTSQIHGTHANTIRCFSSNSNHDESSGKTKPNLFFRVANTIILGAAMSSSENSKKSNADSNSEVPSVKKEPGATETNQKSSDSAPQKEIVFMRNENCHDQIGIKGIGRKLTQADVGKEVVRTWPFMFPDDSCDWSYVARSIRLNGIKFNVSQVIEVANEGLIIRDVYYFKNDDRLPSLCSTPHGLNSEWNDDNWLTVDEYREFLNKNPSFDNFKQVQETIAIREW